MARALRIERAGGWYHLTARGNQRQPIYEDRRDYQHFCELLAEAVTRFRWRLHAYVLMKSHFHLLVETLDPNLSASMQWLGVSYTLWFNRRHETDRSPLSRALQIHHCGSSRLERGPDPLPSSEPGPRQRLGLRQDGSRSCCNVGDGCARPRLGRQTTRAPARV